jgi:hypothetical protein
VNQRQWTRFIADRQREVIVVDETHFFDLGRVINIVEQNTVPEHFRLFTRRHLNRLRSDSDRHFRVLVRQVQRVVEHFEIFF